ncbi:MAG TPA: protocatechuate 3,4-dioxygenase subunit beta [Polyangiaceae bacterium]|nr:protocatechuate 3,4-dioxygenase subunit beta [Polyangiaceae bacterium]
MAADLVYRPLPPGTQPEYLHTPYNSTHKRAPLQAPLGLPRTLSELTGPVISPERVPANAADLTRQGAADPLGERIVVGGRVLDEDGRPLRRTLVEIWQCNAAGRYRHPKDTHDAPLDPNFRGSGQAMTDDDGRYCFISIKPGAYPWRNHHNAWRPAHIHFSLFGPAFVTRLVTQMYFPGDPLLAFDPIFNSVSDAKARDRLIAEFDWDATTPEWALGYRFDIVLRGSAATPFEEPRGG